MSPSPARFIQVLRSTAQALPNALRLCRRDGRAAPGTVGHQPLVGWSVVEEGERRREKEGTSRSRTSREIPSCLEVSAVCAQGGPSGVRGPMVALEVGVVQRETRGGVAQGRKSSGGPACRPIATRPVDARLTGRRPVSKAATAARPTGRRPVFAVSRDDLSVDRKAISR
jgi:hypothetical protein